MTGLHDIDIKLGDNWQLTQAADGDAPLCSELDCLRSEERRVGKECM